MSTSYIPEGYTLSPTLSDARSTEFDAPQQATDASTDYGAVIVTNKGHMVIDLFADRAPVTVNNFVFLAKNKFYDGIVFHRVLEDFMAQTGDPTGTGRGGPGYRFNDEFHPELSHKGKGILSMANAGAHTNGSQFFITFVDCPWLDGKHAVFGKVTEGVEVLDALTRIDPSRPRGSKPDVMEQVYIIEKAR